MAEMELRIKNNWILKRIVMNDIIILYLDKFLLHRPFRMGSPQSEISCRCKIRRL